MKRTFLCCLSLFSYTHIHADNETQLRLNQNLDQKLLQQQQALKQDLSIQNLNELPQIQINGQKYHVEQSEDDLAKALYLTVMQKNWANVPIYLENYKKFENYDKALTEFAEGAMLRAQAKLKQAEQKFRNSLSIQPNNLICELELARILFEQQKNKDASLLFSQIQEKSTISDQRVIPPEILKTIDIFQKAIEKRDSWQGSMAIGPTYANNLNSSSEQSKTWTLYGLDQDKNVVPVQQITRGSPAAESANGVDFDASLIKRFSIKGNHGLSIRGLAFGQSYDDYAQYNESTINIAAGYSYFDQKNQITLSPLFEHKNYGNNSLYNAWGVRAEWMRFISNDKAFKLEAEAKDLDYQRFKNLDGLETSALFTFWKILPKRWTLFSGVDVLDHNTKEKFLASYQQQGVRLGLSKVWNTGFNTTLFSSYRWRQFDEHVATFGTRRHDFEENYTFVLQMPRFKFYGMTPSLTYRYNHNKSNVDWLYSYDKQNLSLKLEHRF